MKTSTVSRALSMRSTVLSISGGLAALMVASASILAGPPASQGFSVGASPSAAMAIAGGPAVDYTLDVISQGYTGRVNLSCQSNEPGVSCSISPSSAEISPTLSVAATVTARASAGVPTGNYSLEIRVEPDGSDPGPTSTVVILEVMPRV